MNEMTSITVTVPLTFRRRGGRKQIIGPDGVAVQPSGGATETRGDPALVKALARAFRWKRMLENGDHASLRELAPAEKVSASYISHLLRLTTLAPDIVEAILDGHPAARNNMPLLKHGIPLLWDEQRRMFRDDRPSSRIVNETSAVAIPSGARPRSPRSGRPAPPGYRW